jgi:hypothetical protein
MKDHSLNDYRRVKVSHGAFLILALCERIIDYTSRPLYPCGSKSCFYKKLGASHSRDERSEEDINFLPCIMVPKFGPVL